MAGSGRTGRGVRTPAAERLADGRPATPIPAGLRHAHTILRTAESLRALLECLPDGLLIMTSRRRIVLLNHKCAEMFGYRQEELLGVRLELLVPPESRAGHARRCAGWQSEPSVRPMGTGNERLGLKKDASTFPVDVALSPLTVGGRPFIVAVVRDATEKIVSEEALEARVLQAVEALRSDIDRFFRLSLDMLCIAGFDGYFKTLNLSWERTLGFSLKALMAAPYVEFVHPDDRDATLAAAARLAEGGNVVAFENRYLHKDGSYRHLLWNAASVPEEQRIFAVAHDITERKQMETELRQARDEMEVFADSVSHDLRAPLRAMLGFGQALLEDYGERLEPAARDFARRIVEAADHMDRLIRDLLTYSRLGRAQLRFEPVDLAAALHESMEQLQAEIAERGALVSLRARSSPVRGHQQTLAQIATNLISNGIKFVESGKTPCVNVYTRRRGGYVRLFVQDNGIGIAPEHQERIFRMFERLHGQEDYPGTGIGLAIAKKAAERMGGRVGVESRPGEGSTFWVDLPAFRSGPL